MESISWMKRQLSLSPMYLGSFLCSGRLPLSSAFKTECGRGPNYLHHLTTAPPAKTKRVLARNQLHLAYVMPEM